MTTPNNSRDEVHVRSDTRFVAVNRRDGRSIIAQGRNATCVATRARSTGTPFLMSFVPKAGRTYVL